MTGPLEMRRAQLTRPWRRVDTAENLRRLAEIGPVPPADDAPVFILAATWRSGSTLLQRLLLSADDVLVWGEPWNRCDLVTTMRRSLAPIDGDWPGERVIFPDRSESNELAEQWVANLFPSAGDLVEAHRAFFRRLFAESSEESRWGAKFVRCDIDDARYLRFLFPSAKLVFLLRDPVEAWRSYRAYNLRSFARWPDRPIITATDFGALWRERVTGFLDHADELDALVVHYEKLGEPGVLDELEAHLDVDVDRSVLDSVVGATTHEPIDPLDSLRLRRSLGSAATRAGYSVTTH